MRLPPAIRVATALLFLLPGGARAQESSGSIGGALGSLLDGVELRRAPPGAADFVVRSRPADLDYAPLAAPPAEPPKTKSASELQKLERELTAAAAANRRRAAGIRVPDGGAGRAGGDAPGRR